jgi:multiple sugar transport system permease protein
MHDFRKSRLFYFALIAPAFGISALLIFYPLINGIRLSFTNSSPFQQVEQFIGLENYQYMVTDPLFWTMLKNTFFIVFTSTTIGAVAGYLLALLLNSGIRGLSFFRAAIFQVWVVPWIVVSILWGWLFSSFDFGIVNYLLEAFGFIDEPQNFLFNSRFSQWAVILAYAWRMIPFMMVISLAALQQVPTEVVEAAKIDGASYIRIQTAIVLPILRNILLVMYLLQIVKSLQELTMVFTLTGGGPVNSTMVISLYTYKTAFETWDFGLASAIGVIWLIGAVIFSFWFMRLSKGALT